MKFSQKPKTTIEGSSYYSQDGNLSEVNNSKKKFRLSFIKKLIWYKKKSISINSLSSLRIEKIKNDLKNIDSLPSFSRPFRKADEEIYQYQRKFHAKKRLLMTRSIDSFARKWYLYSSLSSQTVLPKRLSHSNISLTIISKSTSKQYQSQNAAIIEFEHQSHLSYLEKSHSSPLPMNTNHLYIYHNDIQSAHIINEHLYKNQNEISLQSCISEMENDQLTESASSDEDNVNCRLIQYHENIKKKTFQYTWSMLDFWKKTISILNCVWRKQLQCTGSREFREFFLVLC